MYLLVKILIYLLMAGISFLVFRLLCRLYKQTDGLDEKTSHAINAQYAKRASFSKNRKRLSRMGIMYRFGKYDLMPSDYFLRRLIAGAAVVMLMLAAGIPGIVVPFGFGAGFLLLDVYFTSANRNDNADMLSDIFNIYLNLKIQLGSGIHVIDALQSCGMAIRNKRLKEAMDELITNMSDKTMRYTDAVQIFEDRFSSPEITNMCAFLKSYAQYGVSEKYLADIMSEINDILTAASEKEEHDLDLKTGVISFLFFACVLAMIAYGGFMMFSSISFI